MARFEGFQMDRGNWNAGDSGIIAWAYDNAAANLTSILPSAGVMQLVKIRVPETCIVTNILLDVSTAGSSLTSAGAAIYQNGTLLGQTDDQSTAWQSTQLKTMALAGGPVPVQKGYVYVAFWANGSTLPVFTRGIGRAAANLNLGASDYGFAQSGAGITTTAPASLGNLTASGLSYWAGLS